MIGAPVARQLRDCGVRWAPQPGDRFVVDEPEMVDSVFWVSDFVIEVQEYAGERVLGFNGTTEWALDAVPVERCLWLPREDQLRELLGVLLVRLERNADAWTVVWRLEGVEHRARASNAEEAYAAALLLALQARSAQPRQNSTAAGTSSSAATMMPPQGQLTESQ